MKPGDSPDFFRLPPPPGRSRESTIVLDARGRFWHDGRLVAHKGVEAGLHAWISRHPDDERYVLTNGYDWSYFTVDDAPYQVKAIRAGAAEVTLLLSDGSEEPWDVERTREGADGALYATVKRGAPRGPFEAKFSPHAQAALEPLLVASGDGDVPAVCVGGVERAIGQKSGAS